MFQKGAISKVLYPIPAAFCPSSVHLSGERVNVIAVRITDMQLSKQDPVQLNKI